MFLGHWVSQYHTALLAEQIEVLLGMELDIIIVH